MRVTSRCRRNLRLTIRFFNFVNGLFRREALDKLTSTATEVAKRLFYRRVKSD